MKFIENCSLLSLVPSQFIQYTYGRPFGAQFAACGYMWKYCLNTLMIGPNVKANDRTDGTQLTNKSM